MFICYIIKTCLALFFCHFYDFFLGFVLFSMELINREGDMADGEPKEEVNEKNG